MISIYILYPVHGDKNHHKPDIFISYKVYYVNFRNTYKNSKAEKIYPSMIQKKYVKSNMMAEGVGSLVSS